MLLEALARRGHECAAVTPAFAPSAGPTDAREFRDEMEARRIPVRERPGVFSYRFRGVDATAFRATSTEAVREQAELRLQEFEPDWVLVNDDKRRVLLGAALAGAGPQKVVLLLQTITNMPFGPLAAAPSPEQTDRMREARAIATISMFLQRYLARHGGLASSVLRLPIYGDGPFPAATARPDQGYVTMVNPCLEKGVDVFLPLARALPEVEFAAVRGWGTDPALRRTLEEQPNVRVFEPADDLDEVLAATRVLLAPSLWPETFGYVVPEAMLRGIPVLASDVGGLREAGLGAATLLPVAELERQNGHFVGRPQSIGPWKAELERLLADSDEYVRRSHAAHTAAVAFASTARADRFESFLAGLDGAR
jgi:glycosyltransferase involved in cell wall biosynthesis